jgi:molybdenum cofactor cytidylyltransferase
MRDSGVFREILVVTGHEAAAVQSELGRIGALWVFNPDFAKGMHASIRRGLVGLRSGWAGALIAAVDQPQLRPSDYSRIATGFQHAAEPRQALVRPVFGGQPGNPAILGAGYVSEILAEPDTDRGCAYLFKRHPEAVLEVVMEDRGCLEDFDHGEPGTQVP